jgi:gluconate 2-dehydrogenase gamma chain
MCASMIRVRRRDFLAGTAMLLFISTGVRAAAVTVRLPWAPSAAAGPATNREQ